VPSYLEFKELFKIDPVGIFLPFALISYWHQMNIGLGADWPQKDKADNMVTEQKIRETHQAARSARPDRARQRAARPHHQVEADRVANRERREANRAARPDDQVEADRATDRERVAARRKARSAAQVQAARATDRKRKALQREARSADQVEADRVASNASKAAWREARSDHQVAADRVTNNESGAARPAAISDHQVEADGVTNRKRRTGQREARLERAPPKTFLFCLTGKASVRQHLATYSALSLAASGAPMEVDAVHVCPTASKGDAIE
jgi:hypothetical protein